MYYRTNPRSLTLEETLAQKRAKRKHTRDNKQNNKQTQIKMNKKKKLLADHLSSAYKMKNIYAEARSNFYVALIDY